LRAGRPADLPVGPRRPAPGDWRSPVVLIPADLHGGYVLPGSRFDIDGGIGLLVSQWNTADGWP
jgi:hypothetical protein